MRAIAIGCLAMACSGKAAAPPPPVAHDAATARPTVPDAQPRGTTWRVDEDLVVVDQVAVGDVLYLAVEAPETGIAIVRADGSAPASIPGTGSIFGRIALATSGSTVIALQRSRDDLAIHVIALDDPTYPAGDFTVEPYQPGSRVAAVASGTAWLVCSEIEPAGIACAPMDPRAHTAGPWIADPRLAFHGEPQLYVADDGIRLIASCDYTAWGAAKKPGSPCDGDLGLRARLDATGKVIDVQLDRIAADPPASTLIRRDDGYFRPD